ncbi:phosphate signaling complex protein PhoU [Telmatocola sphagniphila]|jgi:phosphate transport system protein|uniref:Phosphate-specific transport system accessory protein PhoU n=1 Tax=Telmatocola sphagniphila TaxID=1123043 RepID=A0A8E6B628_9BACT|nr:phosphate signaling complex protein PhoU [Telmatocola sphagniphila]QVL32548.1 phosphate signaling complex protein PhoU [Telmatocola sphagniphila]
MSKHLERDLENLQKQIVSLAGMVEDSIYKAILALLEHDRSLAQEVIEGDNRIDVLENNVVEECLKILALHQPVARDLRRIATVFMIAADLERMADLAADISERSIDVPIGHSVPEKLRRMTDLATGLVHQSLDSFVKSDSSLARKVIRMDDDVDRYHAEIINELRDEMKRSPDLIDPCLSLFTATRHIERIADHATNIAEDVIYLVEGEIVRHRPEAIVTGI